MDFFNNNASMQLLDSAGVEAGVFAMLIAFFVLIIASASGFMFCWIFVGCAVKNSPSSEWHSFLTRHRHILSVISACIAYGALYSIVDAILKIALPLVLLSKAIMIVALLLGTIMTFNFLHHHENTTLVRLRELDNLAFLSLIELSIKAARIGIWLPWVLFLLSCIGIDPKTVIALGGIGGIVAGLAAKDVLANAFGMATILLSRYFAVGDLVRIRNVEGRVISMDWRVTKLRAYDGTVSVVPNACCVSDVVVNLSARKARLFSEIVRLRKRGSEYEPVASSIVACKLSKELGTLDVVDHDMECIAKISGVSDMVIFCKVSVFLKTRNFGEFHAMSEDVWLCIYRVASECGYDILEKDSQIMYNIGF